jgi:hypothetical protein
MTILLCTGSAPPQPRARASRPERNLFAMADAHDAPHLLRSRRKDYGLRHDAEIGEAVTLVNPELFFPGNQAGGADDGSIFLKNTRVHGAPNS